MAGRGGRSPLPAAGKEPALVPSEPTSLAGPRELYRILRDRQGLPLRPATARAALAGLDETLDPAPDFARQSEVDPGWVAAVAARGTEGDPLPILAEAEWWLHADPATAPALDRLWRHSVATSRAAGRLAGERQIDTQLAARLGLLMNLGAWSVAFVRPRLWASLASVVDPAHRRAAEIAATGTDLATLGRDLADRWGLPTPLAEALWLPVAHPEEAPSGLTEDQIDLVSLLRKARGWAERTPWALDGPAESPSMPDPRARLLVAEVQVHCAGSFTQPDATVHERALAQSQARLRIELNQRRAAMAEWSRREVLRAGWQPGDEMGEAVDAISPMDQAWRRAVGERDRQTARLDSLTEAYHRLAEIDAATRASERLDALAEFAAGAAHELNNPLAVIMGRAQLLLPRAVDEDAARSLRAIIGQAQRAHRILRDLIYIARPPEPRGRPTLLAEALRTTLRDLADEASGRGQRFEWELGEATSPLRIDPDPLRHAVDALVRNAVEAGSPGATVRLSIRTGDRQLTLQVSDDGPGLDPRAAAHLLDPFFCGRQAGRGLGLGLPRVARWATQMGGSFDWKPSPTGGTTFRLRMPVAGATSTPAPAAPGFSLPAGREAMPSVQAIS